MVCLCNVVGSSTPTLVRITVMPLAILEQLPKLSIPLFPHLKVGIRAKPILRVVVRIELIYVKYLITGTLIIHECYL